MGHVYHKDPEFGAPRGQESGSVSRAEVDPMDAPLPARGRKLKRNSEPVSSFFPLENHLPETKYKNLVTREKNDPGRTTTRPIENDTIIMEHTDRSDDAEQAARDTFDTAYARSLEVRATSVQEAFDKDFQAAAREVADKERRASESWYGRMARGSREVAKAAGSLWSTLTRSNQDPAFRPESLLLDHASDMAKNLKTAAVGSKETPSLIRILTKGLSIENLKTTLGAARQAGGEVATATRETFTRSKTKELKDVEEDFSPTPNLADAYYEAKTTLGEIFGGALEAGLNTPREVWNRKAELANATKYVLGGGFVVEIFAGVRDRLTKKQRADIEAALKDDGSTANGDLKILPTRQEMTESWQELSTDARKTTAELKEFTSSMPRALFEVAKFGGQGLVDLGRGYADMFRWIGQEYTNFETSLREASLENRRADRERQVAHLAAERMDVAGEESRRIATAAEAAKAVLANTTVEQLKLLESAIDELEEQLIEKNRRLKSAELTGNARDRVKSEMAGIELELDQYEAAVEAIEQLNALESKLVFKAQAA